MAIWAVRANNLAPSPNWRAKKRSSDFLKNLAKSNIFRQFFHLFRLNFSEWGECLISLYFCPPPNIAVLRSAVFLSGWDKSRTCFYCYVSAEVLKMCLAFALLVTVHFVIFNKQSCGHCHPTVWSSLTSFIFIFRMSNQEFFTIPMQSSISTISLSLKRRMHNILFHKDTL